MIEKRSYWIVIFMMSFIVIPAFAIPDLSAVYCNSLGYEYTINKTDEGEVGLCTFPDGSTVRAWAFLRGEAKQEYSYCKEKGYEFRVVENDSRCPGMYFGKCVLCVSLDGKETEVTELMKQDGEFPDYEGWTLLSCNHNQICEPGEGEDYIECPEDCPSGGKDDYCDKIEDGKCDPDCSKEQDIDCKSGDSRKAGDPDNSYLLYYIIFAIVIITLVLFLAYRKLRGKKK